MAYAHAQAVKVSVIAQRWNDIPQAIVATVAAALLKSGAAGWDIQFIVSHKNLLRLNLKETGHCRNSLATAIHKCCGNQQPQVVTGKRNTSGQSKKARFFLQRCPALSGQCLYEVGTGVMASAPVFTTGVAQSNNEFDGSQVG
jgi:hypothetical protein